MCVRAEPSPSRWVPSPGLSLTCTIVSVSSVGRAEYKCFDNFINTHGISTAAYVIHNTMYSYDRSLADNRYSYSSHQLYTVHSRTGVCR